jgi:hypothetical protein
VTADEFLIDQLDLEPGVVMRVLGEQNAAHERPPYEVQGLLGSLERGGSRTSQLKRADTYLRWHEPTIGYVTRPGGGAAVEVRPKRPLVEASWVPHGCHNF